VTEGIDERRRKENEKRRGQEDKESIRKVGKLNWREDGEKKVYGASEKIF
jgi:hypothetical protein